MYLEGKGFSRFNGIAPDKTGTVGSIKYICGRFIHDLAMTYLRIKAFASIGLSVVIGIVALGKCSDGDVGGTGVLQLVGDIADVGVE